MCECECTRKTGGYLCPACCGSKSGYCVGSCDTDVWRICCAMFVIVALCYVNPTKRCKLPCASKASAITSIVFTETSFFKLVSTVPIVYPYNVVVNYIFANSKCIPSRRCQLPPHSKPASVKHFTNCGESFGVWCN